MLIAQSAQCTRPSNETLGRKKTTYDWDNGQVMAPRSNLDKLLKELDLSDYTPVRGNLGGRNWNGFQVDDKGYLTGNQFGGPSYLQSGNPIKTFRNVSRFLRLFSKLLYSTSSRAKILEKIHNNSVRNLVKSIYREANIGKELVGTGSAVDAYSWTAKTGQLVGGTDHAIKMLQSLKNAQGILNRETLNRFDKRVITEIINDIKNALKGN